MSFISSLILLLSEGRIIPFHIPFTIVPTEEKLGMEICMDQTDNCFVVAVVVCNTCHHLTQALHLATPLPSRWQLLPLGGAVFPSPGHCLDVARVLMFRAKCIIVRLEMDPPKALWAGKLSDTGVGVQRRLCRSHLWLTEGQSDTYQREMHWDLGGHLLLCQHLFGVGSAAVSCRGSHT